MRSHSCSITRLRSTPVWPGRCGGAQTTDPDADLLIKPHSKENLLLQVFHLPTPPPPPRSPNPHPLGSACRAPHRQIAHARLWNQATELHYLDHLLSQKGDPELRGRL